MNTELENPEADAKETPKLSLDVKVDSVSACERHVTVIVPRDDIERYFEDKFNEIAPKAEVPGFRLGKAPRKLLENRFRKQIADQVKGSLLMDSLAQISEEQDFSAISEPDFDFESIKLPEDGPLTYEFNIEVRPEFDLPAWDGLKLTKIENELSDDDIDDELNALLSTFADLVPVDEPAKLTDVVVVNLSSHADGKEISREEELSIQVKSRLSLSDAVVEDFGKLMVGACAGDSKSIETKISEYSIDDKLRGQTVELRFEILDVKRLDLANQEKIAKKLGATSIDALRTYVATSRASRIEYEQRQHVREQISKLLTESADWTLPQELVKRQSRRELDRAVIEMRSSGFTEAQILAKENFLKQNALEKTLAVLKEHFILERIAEEEEIEESDADYDLQIERIAQQRNDSPRRVRSQMERDGQMDALRNMIVEQKVIDLITEKAEFEAVQPPEKKEQETVAIEFSASGKTDSEIPEAKYDDESPGNLPNTVERD